jgi:hypothetical protein
VPLVSIVEQTRFYLSSFPEVAKVYQSNGRRSG